MSVTRVAIGTTGNKGLHDQVSEAFARSKTFTLVNIENNKVKHVRVVKNPAASKPHGRGPVVIQTLLDHIVAHPILSWSLQNVIRS